MPGASGLPAYFNGKMKRFFLSLVFCLFFGLSGWSFAAILPVLVEASQNNTAQTTYSTSSLTPASGAVYTVSFGSVKNSGTPSDPSLAGTNGWNVTWNKLQSGTYNTTNILRGTVWWGIASSGVAGTITATYTAATSDSAVWHVIRWDGADSSGTIVQSTQAGGGATTSTSLTVTMASAPASSANVTLGIFWHHAYEDTVPGGAATEFTGADNGVSSQALRMQSHWLANSQSPSSTWATSSTRIGFAIEVKATGGLPRQLLSRRRS